jgi:1-acyl-sn-glycerol-3-phosphate acyltransferase
MVVTHIRDALAGSDGYTTAPEAGRALARTFSTVWFYKRVCQAVLRARREIRRTGDGWMPIGDSARYILLGAEEIGGNVKVSGLDHVRGLDRATVFIGNHMSTLETMVLPSILQDTRPTTFVVKTSLLAYPVFGEILGSLKPIAVARENPRDDLKQVMSEGTALLADGMSLIIFPQSTRTPVFDPEQFNSLGIKLARKAGAPVVPLALKTNLWGNGRLVKDFGPISAAEPVRFAFGEPFEVNGNGKAEHQQVVDFIGDHLAEWSATPDS